MILRIAFLGLFLVALAGCSTHSAGPAPEVDAELRATIDAMESAFAADKGDLPLAYYLASLHSEAGNRDRASHYLSMLIREKWELGAADFDFLGLKSDRAIRTQLSTLQKLQPRVAKSFFSFEINDPEFVPEGIDFDPKHYRFVVGSIRQRKIIFVKPGEPSRDLVKSGAGGLAGVLGVRVDVPRNLLWAASFGGRSVPGLDPSEIGDSALFAFNLRTGELVKKLPLTGEGTQQLNDLCVMADGTIYVTDSAAGAIYRASPKHDALEPFLEPGKMPYPNGIVCDTKRNRLIVAQFGGISLVDVESRTAKPLPAPAGLYVGGIDGLYLSQDHLIGIQNAVGSGRVITLQLNDEGDAISGTEVLEAGSPDFHAPTTGTVKGGSFHFIANSQLRMFDDKGNRVPAVPLRKPFFLRVPLPWLKE